MQFKIKRVAWWWLQSAITYLAIHINVIRGAMSNVYINWIPIFVLVTYNGLFINCYNDWAWNMEWKIPYNHQCKNKRPYWLKTKTQDFRNTYYIHKQLIQNDIYQNASFLSYLKQRCKQNALLQILLQDKIVQVFARSFYGKVNHICPYTYAFYI